MSQKELATMAGIKQPTLSAIETGQTKKSFAETVLPLAAALKANLRWVQTGRGEPYAKDEYNQSEMDELMAEMDEQQKALLLALARTIRDGSA